MAGCHWSTWWRISFSPGLDVGGGGVGTGCWENLLALHGTCSEGQRNRFLGAWELKTEMCDNRWTGVFSGTECQCSSGDLTVSEGHTHRYDLH